MTDLIKVHLIHVPWVIWEGEQIYLALKYFLIGFDEDTSLDGS